MCTLDGLYAEHEFRVWVTILGLMSRHFHFQVPAPFYTKGRLGHLNRSERCLFPYSDPSPAQTIYKVCIRGQDIKVQGSTVWPVSSTPHFHKMCGSGTNTFEAAGYKDISVSGQLVNLCQVKRDGGAAYKGSVNAFECSGVCSKPEKELINSNQGYFFKRKLKLRRKRQMKKQFRKLK